MSLALTACRAEQSFTHRHMCEFTGLDFEMEIHEHYNEVLDVLGRLFIAIFKGLQVRYGELLRCRCQMKSQIAACHACCACRIGCVQPALQPISSQCRVGRTQLLGCIYRLLEGSHTPAAWLHAVDTPAA